MGHVYKGVALCERLDLMRLFGTHFEAESGLDLRPPERIEDPAEIDFALAWRPGAEAFAPYPNLRAVFSIAAGTDGITASRSLPRDIPLIRLRDPDQALQMAGFAVFQVLWHHRGMADLIAAQARHDWARRAGGASPSRRRIGILGLGHMGRQIARSLSALGYPVTSLTRRPPVSEPGVTHLTQDRRADFLAVTDILINVLPMTAETRGLLDRALFDALPRGAALIHMGRGGQLVEEDLIAALDAGQISGASLDVFATEPLPHGHPFWDHPKVLVTPHVAGEAEAGAVVENVRRGMETLVS